MKSLSIPTSDVLFVISNNKFYTVDKKRISTDMALTILNSFKDYSFFVKPVDGEGGCGIIHFSSETCFKKEIENKKFKNVFIVQEAIKQNEFMSQINSSSVNTLRVIVHKRDSKMEMKVAILRMGRKGSIVDNSAQGGMSVGVNIETGDFFPTAKFEHSPLVLEEHPDSHFIFKGNGIKGWINIRQEIENYASKLVKFHDIGLDIALTKNGFVFIEFNFRYGIDHIQRTVGGVRRILKVK